MTLANALQYGLFLVVVTAFVIPVGRYIARVFSGQKTILDPLLVPVERLIYRLSGTDPQHEMTWVEYATSFIVFSLVGTLALYLILRIQPLFHTFDPAHRPSPLSPDLAMNTAISFSTTTTWQAYSGENAMSYFSQMAGLAAQNFLAGASGLAVGIAFIRGLGRQQVEGLGNFSVDLVRATLWVLLPLSVIGSTLLIWQGVPMNFNAYTQATTLSGSSQTIPQGPVAALEFIKNLGTNGGGFFNVNGAHPYENPTPLTNFLEMLAIAVLPAALTHTFGHMIGRPRQGWVLYGVMVTLIAVGLLVAHYAEQRGNPFFNQLGIVDQAQAETQAGGNMEGKETRFGIGGSILTAVTTSNGATGSYNSMHDSYMPIGGAVPLTNMLIGEVIFGGLGTGLYSMILVALIALFVGGQMVGRTPQYLGKAISVTELKFIGLYTILGPATVLLLTALAVVAEGGRAGLTTNTGAHGFTEIVFAYASSVANNGQNFAGLSADNPFYNITTAIAMMVGRFGLAIPALALAGTFAKQISRPITTGTLRSDTFLFATLLLSTLIVVNAISYFPILALGPIIEHLFLFR